MYNFNNQMDLKIIIRKNNQIINELFNNIFLDIIKYDYNNENIIFLNIFDKYKSKIKYKFINKF